MSKMALKGYTLDYLLSLKTSELIFLKNAIEIEQEEKQEILNNIFG